jgi:alpha-tubulin suppressor-like RCC1 family protein
MTDRLRPKSVSGLTGATAIAAGDDHTCALVPIGSVKCWGDNIYGGLGDGTATDRLTPVTVQGL